MTKYGDIFKWLRFQRSTFNAAHYNTHWHGLIYMYDTQHHSQSPPSYTVVGPIYYPKFRHVPRIGRSPHWGQS